MTGGSDRVVHVDDDGLVYPVGTRLEKVDVRPAQSRDLKPPDLTIPDRRPAVSQPSTWPDGDRR